MGLFDLTVIAVGNILIPECNRQERGSLPGGEVVCVQEVSAWGCLDIPTGRHPRDTHPPRQTPQADIPETATEVGGKVCLHIPSPSPCPSPAPSNFNIVPMVTVRLMGTEPILPVTIHTM